MSNNRPPPPNGQVLSLVSALSSPENHALHIQAIQARDQALSASPDSYSNLCLQLALLLLASDHTPADQIFNSIIQPSDLEAWRQTDATSVQKIQQDPQQWVPFGQMAGLILKNALTRPPIFSQEHRQADVSAGPVAEQLKECLLLAALTCQHAELRAVASSIVAEIAVSTDGVQPALHVQSWPELIPRLLAPLQQSQLNPHAVDGALATIRKVLEDAPSELGSQQVDSVVSVLMPLLQQPIHDNCRVQILESLASCLLSNDLPSALVLHMDAYIHSLLSACSSSAPQVRQWACRNFVALLELRPDVLAKYSFGTVVQTVLQCTCDSDRTVALDACEFWLTFCSLDDVHLEYSNIQETVQALLPQLIPVLLNNIVYGPDQQQELMAKNALELEESAASQHAHKPIFHKSRAQRAGGEDDEDGDDDDDMGDEEDGNAWTLRKCAAASLDSLAALYGPDHVLPTLLPALEQGLSSQDTWVQEACILALGAVAEGCHDEMRLSQLHPFLLEQLSSNTLPQLQSTAAWTLGRYAGWAVEQVQTGQVGHLLAQMTQVFLELLVQTGHEQVQVACCSAFGVLVEAAGDLMAPYLEPIYQQLVVALGRFYPTQVRSLLMLFDVFGIMADCCGPAIAEGNLPSIYVGPLLQTFDAIASHDQTTLLLPLMEALASIAVTSGTNFQPYALQSFENAMCIIEMTTLALATTDGDNGNNLLNNEEVYDPIICSTDLLDGMVEGLGISFLALVNSSSRYGPHFLTVLHSLCRHDVGGVRMSALALLGDLARNAPALLEPALPELLREAVASTDPTMQSPSVCTNAVWAVGEICVRCEGNPQLVEPVGPALLQNLLGLLTDNVVSGLAENAAACVGRLAKVHPQLVAADLDRLLLGWCDGMGKIIDPRERRDAYEGFLRVVYANPNALQQAANTSRRELADVMVVILVCIATWHVPSELTFEGATVEKVTYDANGNGDSDYSHFRPFPPTEAELGKALAKFMQDMKVSVGDETWQLVQRRLPVNVRRLVREAYQI
jgi:transportin-1